MGIAADGSEVLFTSHSELTEDANTGRTSGVPNHQGSDLYSYDVGTGDLTDLTVDDKPADEAAGADVERVVGASRNADYVYFIAAGDLAPGATSGERNLYVEHGGVIDFVATDPTGDPGQGYPFYVTPDGLHAAFMSAEGQTGYDNAGKSEVYKYSYGSGLECASCRPSGEPPTGDASIAGRALSDDGDRLFFQSTDAVLPQAQSSLSNVFEYVDGEIRLLTPAPERRRFWPAPAPPATMSSSPPSKSLPTKARDRSSASTTPESTPTYPRGRRRRCVRVRAVAAHRPRRQMSPARAARNSKPRERSRRRNRRSSAARRRR